MVNDIKALIIQTNGRKDLGDILQIGRAEAMKIFRNPNKIRVLYHIPCPYGEILVVQNSDGCIAEKRKISEQETTT
jgi:hypothetical protein